MLKSKKLRKRISDLKERMKNKGEKKPLLAALNYYAETLFRIDIASSRENVLLPPGAWLKHFEQFLHGKVLSRTQKKGGFTTPAFNPKVMLTVILRLGNHGIRLMSNKLTEQTIHYLPKMPLFSSGAVL